METVNQPLPAAQQQETPEQQLEKIKQGLALVPDTYRGIQERADRACLALSKIQAINDDATDAIANDLLVKTRVTLEGIAATDTAPARLGVVDTRMGITKLFDSAKAFLMGPEKRMQAEQARLTGLRNGYAQKKLAEKQRLEAENLLKKRKADEEARVRSEMKKAVVNGVIGLINAMNASIQQHVAGMTLENWDSAVKKFSVKPALRQEKYDDLFVVPFDVNLLSQELYAAIVQDTKGEPEYSFATIGAQYVKQAEATIKMWSDGLPEKKAQLEQIAETARQSEADAQRLREEMRAQEQEQAKELETRSQRWGGGMTATIDREHDEAKLKNEFNNQISNQAIAEPTGARVGRVAVITCADADIVKTLAQVLYACYSNPKFKGHLKRDRKGAVLPPDENGVPQYADWVQPLLTFVADNFPGEALEGIKFVPKVSTVAKKS